MHPLVERVILRLAGRRRALVEADEIYYLEAVGPDTRVRLRASRLLQDVRTLGQLEAALARWPFFRIHRSFLVNLNRVREVRPRPGTRGWEVVMASPVNKVLPVANGRARALFDRLGAGRARGAGR
jgi:DNA-binding LytR/AlgR family response regulator